MPTYNSLKKDVLQINKEVSGFFPDAQRIMGTSDHTFAEWQKTCEAINS